MLALFIIVILAAIALQWYFVRAAQNCREIRYDCRPSVQACEPGDVFLVYSTVSNLGRRASLTMRVEERFPMKLDVLEAEEYNVKVLTNEHRLYNSSVVLRGRQQVKRYLRASIYERGEYRFSFADIYAGDFLGVNEYRFRRDNDQKIVVYPPKLEDARLIRAFTNAVDEIALKKLLLEDPISVCGYRDYSGREPMRQISWTQSAVRNRLIVKQFDPVWQYSVTVVLDMQFHGDFDLYRERQEFCFSLTRTLCGLLEQRMMGYRLITNATITGEISRFSSSGGTGSSFGRILYALGSAGNGSVCSVEQLMRDVCVETDHRDTILFVSTCPNDDVRRALAKTRESTGDSIITLFAEDLMPLSEKDSEAKGGDAA